MLVFVLDGTLVMSESKKEVAKKGAVLGEEWLI